MDNSSYVLDAQARDERKKENPKQGKVDHYPVQPTFSGVDSLESLSSPS